MPTIIDALFVSLGWKIEPEGLEKYAKTTDTLKHGMLAVGAAVAGTVYGLERMVRGTAEKMGGIQRFGEQMGINAREVAALGRVAAENGSSMEAMEGGLRQMTMMAGQAAQGVGRGAMIFKRFGIQVKDSEGHVKPMNQLLGDVADKMAKLPSLAQKMALGSRLGFDPAIVPILAKGRAEFERMASAAQKANPFGDKDYENALKTEEGFKKAGQAVQRLRDRLAVGLFPTVNDLLKKFTAWVSNEKNVAKLRDAINKVVEIVGALARNLDKILAVFAVIYAHKYGMMFMEWGTKIMGVVGALGKGAATAQLLATGFKAIQGVLTAGVLGLLILVAEDLWVFHQGGVSVTGWMLTEFPQAVDVMVVALDVLGAAFLALSLGSGPVGVFAFAIGGIVIAAMAIKDAWNPLMQWFEEAWDSLADKVAWFVNKLDAPLRWAAKLFGVDLSMNENHAATRNAAFNADHRPVNARGPQGPAERAAYGRYVGAGAAMMPGLGSVSPFLGGMRGSATSNVITMGDLHFHIDGSKLGRDDSEKLFREFSAKLEARGISQGRDSARVKARNGQGGAH
jgi:hypothetical protein